MVTGFEKNIYKLSPPILGGGSQGRLIDGCERFNAFLLEGLSRNPVSAFSGLALMEIILKISRKKKGLNTA